MYKGMYSPLEPEPIEPRNGLESALEDVLAENRQATRTAERAAATYRDPAGPCTDMLLTAYAAMQLRRLLDRLDGSS